MKNKVTIVCLGAIAIIALIIIAVKHTTPTPNLRTPKATQVYDAQTQGGANGDTIQRLDGTITAGSNTFTSATGSFALADVGKQFTVLGAGTNNAALTTTIQTFNNAMTVTLTDAATTTVTGATYYYGTDDTAALRAGLAAASATNYKSFHLPAGTYLVGTGEGTNDILNCLTDGMEIYGDGMGKTVLQFASNITMQGNGFAVIAIRGSKQTVHDLTIIGPYSAVAGPTGSKAFSGVLAACAPGNYIGCQYPHIHHVEVTNVPWMTTNGSGIGMNDYWMTPEAITQIGTAVTAPGVVTCTPPNNGMQGIYPGRLVRVGGRQSQAFLDGELVTVTATTPTTFTANFTKIHPATDALSLSTDGRIHGVIEYCWLHDSPGGSAIGVSASDVKIFMNHIKNWGGIDSRLHGMYLQGGELAVLYNTIESSGGANIHCHKSTPNFEASGDRIVGNLSINPHNSHIVVDSAAGPNSTNPMVPVGTLFNRFVLIEGNTCRCSNGMPYFAQGISASVPAIVAKNMMEDATGNIGNGVTTNAWISCSASDSKIVDNILHGLFSHTGTIAAQGVRNVVAHNTLMTESASIGVGPFGTIDGNTLYVTGRFGAGVGPGTVFNLGPNSKCIGNTVDIGKGCNPPTGIFGGYPYPINWTIKYNHVSDNTNNVGNTWLTQFGFGPMSGEITDNYFGDMNGNPRGFIRYANASPALKMGNNFGSYTFYGYGSTPLDKSSGELFVYPLGTNSITNGLLVALDANGCVRNCTTSDTNFIGMATSSTGGGKGIVGYVTVIDNGSNYTSPETCTFVGGNGGINAAATVYMGGGPATVVNGGTNYNIGDILNPVGTNVAQCTYGVTAVNNGVVTAVQPINAGQYTTLLTNPVVTTNTYPVAGANTGAGCTLNMTWNVSSIVMTNYGSGYKSAPLVTFSGMAGGTGAKATSYITSVYLAGKVGAELPLQTDGAWINGDIGILSTTSGGKIHDTGTQTAPTSPTQSYIRFMNSGGGVGTARCQIIKAQ